MTILKFFTENLPFSLEVDYCKAYDSLIRENFKSKSNNALNDVQCLTFKGGMIAAITNLERSATQRGILWSTLMSSWLTWHIREDYFRDSFRFKFYVNAFHMRSNKNHVILCIRHGPHLMFLWSFKILMFDQFANFYERSIEWVSSKIFSQRARVTWAINYDCLSNSNFVVFIKRL